MAMVCSGHAITTPISSLQLLAMYAQDFEVELTLGVTSTTVALRYAKAGLLCRCARLLTVCDTCACAAGAGGGGWASLVITGWRDRNSESEGWR